VDRAAVDLQKKWERILIDHGLGMSRGQSQLVYVGLLHRRYDSPHFCRGLPRLRKLAEAFDYSVRWKPRRSDNYERVLAAMAGNPEFYRAVNRKACAKYRGKKG